MKTRGKKIAAIAVAAAIVFSSARSSMVSGVMDVLASETEALTTEKQDGEVQDVAKKEEQAAETTPETAGETIPGTEVGIAGAKTLETEAETEHLPETMQGALSETMSDNGQEKMSESLSEAVAENLSGVATENASEEASEHTSEVPTEGVSEAVAEGTAETASGDASENETEQITEIETEMVSGDSVEVSTEAASEEERVYEYIPMGKTDVVKYVPFTYKPFENPKDGIILWNINYPTDAFTDMGYDQETGELIGVPGIEGEFPIEIQVDYEGTYSEVWQLTLDVKANSKENVADATFGDVHFVGMDVTEDGDYVLEEISDQTVVVENVKEILALWLNGVELVEGVDYTYSAPMARSQVVGSGATITIFEQTFEDLADKDGINTLVIKVEEDKTEEIKYFSQNFRYEGLEPDTEEPATEEPMTVEPDTEEPTEKPTERPTEPPTEKPAPPTEKQTEAPAATEAVKGEAAMSFQLIDESGAVMAGVTVELHSDPQTAVADSNGMVRFTTVEFGAHTITVKDVNGAMLATKNFDVVAGASIGLDGDSVTAPNGSSVYVKGKVQNGELILLSAEDQKAVPETGDSTNLMLWLTLAVCAGATFCLLAGRRKE